jgi:hypothetical protein
MDETEAILAETVVAAGRILGPWQNVLTKVRTRHFSRYAEHKGHNHDRFGLSNASTRSLTGVLTQQNVASRQNNFTRYYGPKTEIRCPFLGFVSAFKHSPVDIGWPYRLRLIICQNRGWS